MGGDPAQRPDPIYIEVQAINEVLQNTTKYYKVLQSTTKYCKVLQSTTKYYNVLQRTTKYYEVLRSTTKYYEVLRSTTKYYNLQRLQEGVKVSQHFVRALLRAALALYASLGRFPV